MKSIKRLVIAVAVALIVGCSSIASLVGGAAVDAVTGDSDGLSVDTEITAGDKNQSVETGKITKSSTRFDDVTVKDGGQVQANTNNTTKAKEQNVNASSVIMNDGVTFWQAGIACAAFLIIGWLLPQLRFKINK